MMCFFTGHHWHRFATVLARKSPDCVGEEQGRWRCCRCARVVQGFCPWVFNIGGDGVGRPLTVDAYRCASELEEISHGG